jgi:uncharacterized protein
MLEWSREEARRYQLHAVGLLGKSYPAGDDGIRHAFSDLGSIQLDPLPVLGRNHDLVIQARVDGTHPDQVLDLIHRERLGFEYWNKAMCIITLEHYPLLRRLMEHGGDVYTSRRADKLAREYPTAVDDVLEAVRAHGPLSSRELGTQDIAQGEHRGWKSTKAANAALEVLWNDGRITVSHRDRYRRYFDLSERIIPAAVRRRRVPAEELWAGLLRERIRTVGLLPAAGDAEAWMFVRCARTNGALAALLAREDIVEVRVAGIKTPFLALGDAGERLTEAERAEPDAGVARFLGPLDPFLWARTGLERLWAFRYTWEVYKPQDKREFGYYVLPVLVGDRLVGRFDGALDRAAGALRVHAYYPERDEEGLNDPAVHAGFQRFLAYLDAESVTLPDGQTWKRESKAPPTRAASRRSATSCGGRRP